MLSRSTPVDPDARAVLRCGEPQAVAYGNVDILPCWLSDVGLRDELVLQQGTKGPLPPKESCGQPNDELRYESATREQPLPAAWDTQ